MLKTLFYYIIKNRMEKMKNKNLSILKYSSIYFIFIFIFIGFIFLSACKKSEDTQSSKTNDSIKKNLDSKLDSIYTQKVPGIYVYIKATDLGFTYEKSKGYSDIAYFRGMAQTDLFRIGQVTNSFTSTVLLQLAGENKISLDSMLNKYFPSVPNSQNITIRQLLNMTSGLYDYTTDSVFLSQLKSNPTKVWTPAELVNYSVNHSPYFPPGTGWHYSSTNSILIGMIIEQITGNTLKQEIQNRILTPLNLSNTYFPTDQNMPSGTVCNGYSLTSGPGTYENITTRFHPSWIWASGAMISNLVDMKTWVKALVNGSIINSSLQQERLKLIYSGTPSVKYGLGLYDFNNGFNGYKGAIPGYNNYIVYFPNRGTTIAILINLYKIDNTSYGYPNLDALFSSVVKTLYPDISLNEDIFIVN